MPDHTTSKSLTGSAQIKRLSRLLVGGIPLLEVYRAHDHRKAIEISSGSGWWSICIGLTKIGCEMCITIGYNSITKAVDNQALDQNHWQARHTRGVAELAAFPRAMIYPGSERHHIARVPGRPTFKSYVFRSANVAGRFRELERHVCSIRSMKPSI